MRRMRQLLLLVAVVSIMNVLTTATAAPPPTPEARDRGRLRKSGAISGILYTHSEAVQVAQTDAVLLSKTMSPEELGYIRYLDMHNIPSLERKYYYGVVSVILNSFSKRKTIVRPAFGGPENTLIRVNLFDYQIDPGAWDRLAIKDLYFHQIILATDVITKEVTVNDWHKTGRFYQNGQPEWAQGPITKTVTETTPPIKKQVQAAWLDAAAAGRLGVVTRTSYPILRADWFITNVTLEPHYSDFLGIKTLADLKKFGAWDERAATTEVRATIVTSGSDGMCARVARNNRILARRNTIYGDWWETFDYNQSIGEKNVILNFLNNKRDAAEYIVRAPNGLQWYLLTNGKDETVTEGDIKVVVDSLAQDAIVKNGRSCMWCHAQGINAFKSHFQKQVGFRPDQSDLGFFDKDPKKALILKQKTQDLFGLPDFDAIILGDQARYNAAVRACSDFEAGEFAAVFARVWNGYQEDYVDNAKACYELGLTEEELRMVLGLRFEGRSNGILIQALLNPPIAIRREHWEESFAEAALLSTLKGQLKHVPVVLPPKNK